MANITKQVIKEAVLEVIEPFAKATQKEFTKIGKQFEQNEEVHTAIIKKIEDNHAEIKKEFADMKNNASEVFTKLDKFVGYFEKHHQEHTFLGAQMRRLEERIEKLEVKK